MSSREPDIHAVQTGAHLIILRMLVMRELEETRSSPRRRG